uniref:Anhydromevalonate phosphate decarboxylase n=2 Tax=Staphylothermus marinus TaxID=2280 RepID=A0A7C4D7E4_STAMA
MNIHETIDFLKSKGRNVVYITSVDRELEITRLAYEHREDILVFQPNDSNYKCVTNILSSRKDLYVLMGVEGDRDAYNKLINSMSNPVKPEFVDFNEYFVKTDHGLKNIPFIKYFKEDGGYFLTSSIIAACINNICNASIHRVMLIDDTRAVVRIVPRHLHYIHEQYRSDGRDTPVAIVLGVNPLIELAAASSPPLGVYEIYVAGNLTNDPRVVKTPLYGIPVPASSSIVIEGVLSRDEVADEGPFVDILGLVDKRRKQPVFKLNAIYVNKRFEPLVHAIIPSFTEHIILMGFPREVSIYNALIGNYDVVKIRLTQGSAGWLHAVLSIRKRREGEGIAAGLSVIHAHPSVKHVIVVDNDIDIDNPMEVEWAIATRFKASENMVVLKNMPGSTLDPRSEDGLGDKLVIDATKPLNEPWDKYRRVNIP